MPHFFVKSNDVEADKIKIDDKENFNHITKSLRMSENENILLIDEKQIQYECLIEKIGKNTLTCKIIKQYPSQRYLDFNLNLAQSPLRSEKQLLLIEKSTELGVNHLYPILTDNCSVKKTVIQQKIEKWQKIMVESSKQCERAFIPQCHDITTIQKLCDEGIFDRLLAFTERSAQYNVKKYLSEYPIRPKENILIIIGPEGGFSQKEFEYFTNNEKIVTLSLGNLILRAETAVITAIGNIVL